MEAVREDEQAILGLASDGSLQGVAITRCRDE
jgi:hypothetical protein